MGRKLYATKASVARQEAIKERKKIFDALPEVISLNEYKSKHQDEQNSLTRMVDQALDASWRSTKR